MEANVEKYVKLQQRAASFLWNKCSCWFAWFYVDLTFQEFPTQHKRKPRSCNRIDNFKVKTHRVISLQRELLFLFAKEMQLTSTRHGHSVCFHSILTCSEMERRGLSARCISNVHIRIYVDYPSNFCYVTISTSLE